MGYRGPTKLPKRVTEMEPVKRSALLRGYVGKWVAVKEGRVVASAETAGELVKLVKALGEEGQGAIAEYVSPPSSILMVGVG